jgi:hypothetical protein
MPSSPEFLSPLARKLLTKSEIGLIEANRKRALKAGNKLRKKIKAKQRKVALS